MRSRRPLLSLTVAGLLLVVAFPVAAQEGPCAADGSCPDGQTCLATSAGGARSCFKTCTPTSGSTTATECTGDQTCIPLGTPSQNVCVGAGGVESGTDAGSGPADEAPPPAPFTPITPNLGVPIPGLSLTPASRDSGNVNIPFLAEYINALYRYAVGITLVAAIIMVVYGGFRYLVGAGVGGVQRGKEIIRDAIVGMLLVISAYLILNTLNPATTTLRVLSLPFVAADPWVTGETDVDFGDAEDPNFTPPVTGTPFEPTELASLEMCEQLRPFIENGTINIPQPQDRAGILGGTGFIQRPSGSQWCQLVNSTRDDPSCPDLPTRADFDRVVGGRPVNFDDNPSGVPIHPMLCRYLLDLAQAKTRGDVTGTISAKIVGRHHRCADGAWFFRSEESNRVCSTLTRGRNECIDCVEDILAGSIQNSGQSNHWTGQAFDMTQNNSVQRYTVEVLAPRYREENGGQPVFNDVFGGNIDPYEGTVNCANRRARIRTKAYCVDGNCGSPTQFVSVSLDPVCGHYSGGNNAHIHVSFY